MKRNIIHRNTEKPKRLLFEMNEENCKGIDIISEIN